MNTKLTLPLQHRRRLSLPNQRRQKHHPLPAHLPRVSPPPFPTIPPSQNLTSPSSCPYVTSVGGTHNLAPERAVYFSSGGFSDIWPRPSYQSSAVQTYLHHHLKSRWTGLYNPHGRGFPDVAAQGYKFHVFSGDKDILVSGTSASAPLFAALISLLNNARLAAGKPALGFLNPWLYSKEVSGKKGGFTDIVEGWSTGCTGKDVYSGLPTPFVPYASWNATPGWDPVTGLGTPLFDRLLELAVPGGKLPQIGHGKHGGRD